MIFPLSLLEKSDDQTVVKRQDETAFIAYIAANEIGRRLVFDYLEENWDYFYKTFDPYFYSTQ
jgi:hypothetical protein